MPPVTEVGVTCTRQDGVPGAGQFQPPCCMLRPDPVGRARIEYQGGPHAWLLWSLAWTGAAPGPHRLTSRAIDSEGRVQPTVAERRAEIRSAREDNSQWERAIELRGRVVAGVPPKLSTQLSMTPARGGPCAPRAAMPVGDAPGRMIIPTKAARGAHGPVRTCSRLRMSAVAASVSEWNIIPTAECRFRGARGY
jgi:hypothetical protein